MGSSNDLSSFARRLPTGAGDDRRRAGDEPPQQNVGAGAEIALRAPWCLGRIIALVDRHATLTEEVKHWTIRKHFWRNRGIRRPVFVSDSRCSLPSDPH